MRSSRASACLQVLPATPWPSRSHLWDAATSCFPSVLRVLTCHQQGSLRFSRCTQGQAGWWHPAGVRGDERFPALKNWSCSRRAQDEGGEGQELGAGAGMQGPSSLSLGQACLAERDQGSIPAAPWHLSPPLPMASGTAQQGDTDGKAGIKTQPPCTGIWSRDTEPGASLG